MSSPGISAKLNSSEEHPVEKNRHQKRFLKIIFNVFCNVIPCSPLPVNVGGQEDSCVCRQLGQMNHLGLQLQSVALIHPHIRQSDAHRNTLTSLSGNWQTTAKMTSYDNSGVSGRFRKLRTYMSSGVQCSSTFTFPESSFLLAITWKPKESRGGFLLWYPALRQREN